MLTLRRRTKFMGARTEETRMRLKAAFFIAALTLAQPVFAATNPWLGTWKVNRDKSIYTGSTTTVKKIPNGYHFDFGAVKYDVIEDGQDHEILPGRVANLKATGKNEWLQVSKIDGKEVGRTTLKLSDDGKVLTQTATGTTASGDTYKTETKMTRLDASTGLAGTWKIDKESSSAKTIMVYSDAGAGKLKMDFPEGKSSMTVAPGRYTGH